MPEQFQNFLDGRWTDSEQGATFEQRNPACLDQVTGLWPAATRADARRAIEAATRAYPLWSRLTPHARAEYLKRAHVAMLQQREDLAMVLTKENGKTLAESRTEIDAAVKEMEFQIHEGLRWGGELMPSAMDGVLAYSVRRPLGAVSIVSPWNFPFNVPGRKVTPALMAGNTCVFKPSSLTPQTGLRFARLLIDAGLPAGVLNFITGGGGTVGAEMVTHPQIKAVSFTGSTAVGRQIHQQAAAGMVRTQLEMGGKNPIVVLEDADVEQAARSAVTAAYACAGQWCTSTSRAIVVRQVCDDFMDRAVALARHIVVGDGMHLATTMGPVCGVQQCQSVLRYIELGKAEGARIVLGGSRLTGAAYDTGCFIEPTIFSKVIPSMTIAREEIFGPVLSILEAADFDAAVEMANAVDYGLASSIYTSDLRRALTFVERTDVGLTHVNLMTALKEPQLSFGGVKASGFGLPEAGRTGLEFFSEHKVAYVKYR